jgi:DNA-binding SARP family transcriptional activator
MQLYAWSGQRSAALRQYQECQHILQAELGLEPEAETQALYQAIKTRHLATLVGVDESAYRSQPPNRTSLDQRIHFCMSPDGVRPHMPSLAGVP